MWHFCMEVMRFQFWCFQLKDGNSFSKKSVSKLKYWKRSNIALIVTCSKTAFSKTCWKEQPFIFTAYLMNHIFQTSKPLVRVIECIELYWLFKHMKKMRSNQAAIPCTVLSKTQFLSVSNFKYVVSVLITWFFPVPICC